MRVYKFYSARWGLDALYRRRLKVATAQDINDPFEFLAVAPNKKDRRTAKKIRDHLFSESGLISFCLNWRQPLLWSHYAENHSGLALGFDIDEKSAFEVTYTDQRVIMPGLEAEEYVFGQRLNFWDAIQVVKYASWRYEQEVRVFPTFKSSIHENGLYFRKFDDIGRLKEVILGCKYLSFRNLDLQNKLEKEHIEIKTARLSLKDFSIVEQKNKMFRKNL